MRLHNTQQIQTHWRDGFLVSQQVQSDQHILVYPRRRRRRLGSGDKRTEWWRWGFHSVCNLNRIGVPPPFAAAGDK